MTPLLDEFVVQLRVELSSCDLKVALLIPLVVARVNFPLRVFESDPLTFTLKLPTGNAAIFLSFSSPEAYASDTPATPPISCRSGGCILRQASASVKNLRRTDLRELPMSQFERC